MNNQLNLSSLLSLCVLILISGNTLFAQKLKQVNEADTRLADEYQEKFEYEKFIATSSIWEYDFSMDKTTSSVKAKLDIKEEVLALKSETVYGNALFYDDNSSVDILNFFNWKGKKIAFQEQNGPYQSDGIFHSDAKMCEFACPINLRGEKISYIAEKEYTDLKYLTSVYFTSFHPIHNKIIKITVPDWLDVEIKEMNFEGNEVERKISNDEKGNKVYYYQMKELAPDNQYGRRPGPSHYLPHLIFLCKSYEDKGKKVKLIGSLDDLYGWYSGLVKTVKNNTAELKPIVAKLTAGKNSDKEKVESIFYWVQDNIRYVAFEDGIAGFRPDGAGKVCENKYGDCKGMANLTKEMLQIAGYDARLTWIGTRRLAYDYSIPSLAVDNHMICSVELEGKRYFLDATEKFAPLGEYAHRIQSKQVLIEDGDKYILDKVPELQAKDNAANFDLKLKIEGTQLVGTYQLTMEGESRRDFLYDYNNVESGEKETALKKYLNNNDKNLKVSNIETSDLEDRNQAVEINYDIEIANHVIEVGKELYLDLDSEKPFQNYKLDTLRDSDFVFSKKLFSVYKSTVEIPAGYQVTYLPETLKTNHPDFDIEFTYTQKGNKIEYKRVISMKNAIIRQKDIELWNEIADKIDAQYNDRIIVAKP